MKRLLCLALVCALAPAATAAAQGRLDPSFGDGGRAVLATALSGADYAREGSVAEAPDGHVYAVVGERTVFGFGADGRVDQGFGTGGAIEPFPPGELIHGPVGIAVDPLGRILVAATIVPNETPPPGSEDEPPEPVPDRPQAVFIARFTPGGTLDPSFGDGGRLVTRLGFPPPAVPDDPLFGEGTARLARVGLSGIAIGANGRIILSGQYLASYEVCRGSRPWGRGIWDAYVARLDDAGTPDPGFGQNGHAVLHEGPVGPPSPDEGGGVYASVGTPLPCETSRRESRGYLFRLDAAGEPVTNYGLGGWRPIEEDTGMKLLPDGRGGLVTMTGLWPGATVFRRLRADGSWDRHFGRLGFAEPFSYPQGTLSLRDAAIGRGGRIYVVGSWKRKSRPNAAKRRFLLFRLNRRGRLDRRYGVLRTGFGRGTTALALSLLIAPGGGAIALGPYKNPLAGSEGLALARYLP
jgi:uncharacterized delta-60 repeat protein